MKILLIYIAIMGAGIALGYKSNFSSKSASRGRFQTACLLVILFLLGHQLGADPAIASSMTSMGLTGLLLCGREGEPLLAGGSGSDSREQSMPPYLPDRLEAGTHNVPGAAGLTAGMRYGLDRGADANAAHEQKLLSELVERLSAMDGVELFAGAPGTQSGVLSFRLRDFDCEEAAQRLAEHGVCLRSGLHCAPTAHRSAGTLETGTLRLSFSPFTGAGEPEDFCRVLEQILRAGA